MSKAAISTRLRIEIETNPGTPAPLRRMRPAQVYSELERIRSESGGGVLEERAVWLASRKKTDLLYSCFTWDDRQAAAQWRDQEARCIVEAVVFVDANEGTSVRAWSHVTIKDRSGYILTTEAVAEPELKSQVMQEILRYLAGAKSRLQRFQGFAREVSAVDRVIRIVARRAKKQTDPEGPAT